MAISLLFNIKQITIIFYDKLKVFLYVFTVGHPPVAALNIRVSTVAYPYFSEKILEEAKKIPIKSKYNRNLKKIKIKY